MSMIVETTMTENNKMWYSIEACGTKYQGVGYVAQPMSVLAYSSQGEYELDDMYAVWSKGNSLTTTNLVLMTLNEMKARSKALNHLATLIELLRMIK